MAQSTEHTDKTVEREEREDSIPEREERPNERRWSYVHCIHCVHSRLSALRPRVVSLGDTVDRNDPSCGQDSLPTFAGENPCRIDFWADGTATILYWPPFERRQKRARSGSFDDDGGDEEPDGHGAKRRQVLVNGSIVNVEKQVAAGNQRQEAAGDVTTSEGKPLMTDNLAFSLLTWPAGNIGGPQTGNQPQEMSKPEETRKPGETRGLEETSKSEETSKPLGTSKPRETREPKGTRRREETSKPEETRKVLGTRQPPETRKSQETRKESADLQQPARVRLSEQDRKTRRSQYKRAVVEEHSSFDGKYNQGYEDVIDGVPGHWEYASYGGEGSAEAQAQVDLAGEGQLLPNNPTADQVAELRTHQSHLPKRLRLNSTRNITLVWVPDDERAELTGRDTPTESAVQDDDAVNDDDGGPPDGRRISKQTRQRSRPYDETDYVTDIAKDIGVDVNTNAVIGPENGGRVTRTAGKPVPKVKPATIQPKVNQSQRPKVESRPKNAAKVRKTSKPKFDLRVFPNLPTTTRPTRATSQPTTVTQAQDDTNPARDAVKLQLAPLPRPGGGSYSIRTTEQANPVYRQHPMRKIQKSRGLRNVDEVEEEFLGEDEVGEEDEEDEDVEEKDLEKEDEVRGDEDEHGESLEEARKGTAKEEK